MTRPARGAQHGGASGLAMRADPAPPAFDTPWASAGPMTPFGIADELTCYYDAPAEPSNVHIEVRVPGHLDERALRRAVGAALAAQPRAMVRRAARRWWQGYSWEVPGHPDRDPLGTASWADEEELARQRAGFLAAAPPLDSSPPVRILLAAGPGEDRIIMNAHHAALDGLSCLGLLGSISRHYPGGAGGPASEPQGAAPGGRAGNTAPHEPPADRADQDGGSPWTPERPRPPGLLPRPAARIAAEPDAHDRAGNGFRLLRAQPVPVVREAGRRAGGTVNDVLIAALIVAIGRWNASHERRDGPIRITMPVNSRPRDQVGAAGNLSRLASVTARVPAPGGGLDGPGGLGGPGGLVADVAAQTRAAKGRAGPQVDPLSRALAMARCPPAVKRRLLRLALRTAGPLLCDTSLISNLGIVGDAPRFGNSPATAMWFSTSAHMPRGLSVGAITLGGHLHLCLRYRRAMFSEPAAARFADGYAAALSDIIGRRR
jgi:NRPS condensation-like uncharacterized protein